MTIVHVQRKQTQMEERIRKNTLAQANTSQMIRYLHGQGKSVREIEDLLMVYGVRTKEGGHIRYQHIRNILMMRLANETQ